MEISVLKEEGHDIALMGMSYSFKDGALPVADWWKGQRQKAANRAILLAPKDGGHNGFLESITVWIDVQAPRCWWSEMDRYRVGKTQLSESSMHTLAKRPPTFDDFEEGTSPDTVLVFQSIWEEAKGDITALKMNLPEGFLQRRVVTTNYKVLRNIIAQRTGHRLKVWKTFIDAIMAQVEHPEYLVFEARA